jgi:hypothetical protein
VYAGTTPLSPRRVRPARREARYTPPTVPLRCACYHYHRAPPASACVQLTATGAFVCGAKPTIADFTLFCIVRNWTLGHIDYVPTDCLAPFPEVVAWLDRVKALPQLGAKKW